MTDTKNNGEKSPDFGSGYLEISEKGFGFLRTAANHFHPKPTDIFVTPDTIRRNFLREGSHVAGTTQPPHRGTSRCRSPSAARLPQTWRRSKVARSAV